MKRSNEVRIGLSLMLLPTVGSSQGMTHRVDAIFRRGSAVEIFAAASEIESILKVKADGVTQFVGNNGLCLVHIFRERRNASGELIEGDHYIVDFGVLSARIDAGKRSSDDLSVEVEIRTADETPSLMRIFSTTHTRAEGSARVSKLSLNVPAGVSPEGTAAGVDGLRRFSSLCSRWW